ncbi:AraC family transcriptional regulator [Saccharibacillus kuerlensis]|uniref:AraC family transcriptional regulator n=1 Tax=Saccharibacillus kuerlensis TaxID=459527 RepID=A0ABQ2L170_9BACL|nr:AraC family transcriptional regulator [Saccharibacillus kuerlensis]GGN99176.1 AraC family transcriptional regulator [Saccharibacillus kuerlensis]
MNHQQLAEFLLTNNEAPTPDWEMIKQTYHSEPILLNGREVYEFNMSFDQSITPIEDHIVISQQLPFSYVPLHMHEYIELIYVYRGECTLVFEERELCITEGSIIMINKQTPHRVKETSLSDIIIDIKVKHDYLSSGFLSRFTNRSIIAEFLVDSLVNTRKINNYLCFHGYEGSNVSRIMNDLMCEYFDKDAFSGGLIESYLFILFTELVRGSNQRSSDSSSPHVKEKDIIVLELLKYLEEHYKKCALADMADQFKYHPNYISSLLKKATGRSFTDLLQIQRLHKASLYLKNSDLPIPEIAEEVGYSSVSFFYKKFNELFGQTPKDYRKENRL